MEVALTFGAVGDIISLVLLAKDLFKALDDCRGSAKSYCDLIDELDVLNTRLEKTKSLYEGELPDECEDTKKVALALINKIRGDVEAFCGPVCKKYAASLAEGGSGNVVKDFVRKIEWKFKEKEIEKFRQDISGHCRSLDWLDRVTQL